MPLPQPFYRTIRELVHSRNSGWSAWQYMRHPDYAKAPRRYIQGFLMIQKDFETVLEYLDATDENANCFGYRIHELLMRTCVEVEANFKAILSANKFDNAPKNLSMKDYSRVERSHKLSGYDIFLPIRNGDLSEFSPFGSWESGGALPWYQAYNSSKHSRHDELKDASLKNLTHAVGGLAVLLTAQFGSEDYSGASRGLGIGGDEMYKFDEALGSLFRIRRPSGWALDEMYDFDWENLKASATPFAKFDYDSVSEVSLSK